MKGICYIVLFSATPFLAQAATSVCSPYTFIGRVMDAKHDAFGADRAATIEASNADGTLLAKTETFFREDSRRNYALRIPMATSVVDGYAVTNAAIDITVKDDLGKVWRGVVVDAAAGVPGGVREVDIVLGADANGDGIDDSLYAQLEAQWEESDYWRPNESFDPHKDYDGDGVSTIAEALAGTNPYDPQDVLRITAFTHAGGARSRATGADLLSTSGGSRSRATAPSPMALTFDAIGGRSYMVEEATSLTAKDWTPREFFTPDSDTAVNVLSVPSGSGRAPNTIYLLPTSTSNAFFRVRAE